MNLQLRPQSKNPGSVGKVNFHPIDRVLLLMEEIRKKKHLGCKKKPCK